MADFDTQNEKLKERIKEHEEVLLKLRKIKFDNFNEAILEVSRKMKTYLESVDWTKIGNSLRQASSLFEANKRQPEKAVNEAL